MTTSEYTNEVRRESEVEPAKDSAKPQYAETASATTNPDNANSGAKPLVIAGVGFLALLLVSLALGSCIAGLADTLARRSISYRNEGYTTNGITQNDLDNLFEDFYPNSPSDGRRPTGDPYLN
ncbi:MAG: hypothetical protein J6D54_03670 [Olsenella sp.]|nr:hypothetical protein [Olsenella sp.]